MFIKNRLSILFTILLIMTGCSKTEAPPLRLGTNIWPGYEPFYLAREIQQWDEQQIRLIEYPSSSEVLRAFRNRTLEAAALTLDEVILLQENNIPVTIVLVLDISNGADVIIARNDLHAIRELKGKRVGVESSALGAYIITRALEINNMSLDDIKLVPLDVNKHERSFNEGKIDAVVTFEPTRTRLLATGANEIFNTRQLPGEIVDVLVIHNDFIKQNSASVSLIIEHWFKALEYMQTHPDDAAILISKRMKISPAEVTASYEGLTLPDNKVNFELMTGQKPQLYDTMKNLHQVMLNNHLVTKEITDQNIITTNFLPKIK